MSKTETAPAVETPTATPLEEGQVSIIAEGKEVVFAAGQMELAGMPDITRLRVLAGAFVQKHLEVEEHKTKLGLVKQEIMMELRQEGRTSFAYRGGGRIFFFEITASEEKLEITKK